MENKKHHNYTLALILLFGVGLLVQFVPEGTKQCSDFSSYRAAQRYFKSHNAYYLDGDSDGVACESLI